MKGSTIPPWAESGRPMPWLIYTPDPDVSPPPSSAEIAQRLIRHLEVARVVEWVEKDDQRVAEYIRFMLIASDGIVPPRLRGSMTTKLLWYVKTHWGNLLEWPWPLPELIARVVVHSCGARSCTSHEVLLCTFERMGFDRQYILSVLERPFGGIVRAGSVWHSQSCQLRKSQDYLNLDDALLV